MAARQVNKQKQAEEREERMNRRRSGVASSQYQPAEPKRKKRKTKREELPALPEPEHPLSEYEKLRLKKIQRNQDKLASLGLLTEKDRQQQVYQV